MPAWIQAVGSVVAIFAAVGIMTIQIRHQERNALKQAHDEHANLVLSTLFYARHAHELFRTIKEAITESDEMPLPLLTFALDTITTTLKNINAIPIWKMAATDALQLAVIQMACRNFSASLQTIFAAEERRARTPHLRMGDRLIRVQGLRNSAKICEQDSTDSISRLHDSYTSLTGVRAPGFPVSP